MECFPTVDVEGWRTVSLPIAQYGLMSTASFQISFSKAKKNRPFAGAIRDGAAVRK